MFDKEFNVRGFRGLNFKDYYGHSCSIQDSSLATEDAIWLGLDGASPKVLHGHAKSLGVDTDATCGWVDYPIPEQVFLNTRMHLNKEQASHLIKVLQRFVDNGTIGE